MTVEEAKQLLCGLSDELYECGYINFEEHEALNMAVSALSENKGEWKKAYLDHVAMGERPSIFYCSVCHQCIAYPTNFCPNCGADMRSEPHKSESEE